MCNFHYEAMPMMMSQICGFHKNTKILISLDVVILSLNEKIHLLHIKNYFTVKDSFVA